MQTRGGRVESSARGERERSASENVLLTIPLADLRCRVKSDCVRELPPSARERARHLLEPDLCTPIVGSGSRLRLLDWEPQTIGRTGSRTPIVWQLACGCTRHSWRGAPLPRPDESCGAGRRPPGSALSTRGTWIRRENDDGGDPREPRSGSPDRFVYLRLVIAPDKHSLPRPERKRQSGGVVHPTHRCVPPPAP